jgi:hypothetical protein
MFAPNWTLSSFNIAGGSVLLGKAGLGPTVSKEEIDFMLKTYWPGIMTVVAGWPMALQAAIALAFGTGDDDEEDFLLPGMNEEGKEFHVDITPLMRKMPWFRGGDNAQRRVYMRWGKQVWEVFDPTSGWYADTKGTLLRKMSTPTRTIMEQITGERAGADDWALDFKDQGFLGLFQGAEKGFWGSRIAHIGSAFVPYSLNSMTAMIDDPDSRDKFPFSWIAATSRGTTKFKLTEEYTKLLMAYANNDTWTALQANPASASKILASMSIDMRNAANRNGISMEEVVLGARRRVLGKLYGDFIMAMEKKDQKEADQLARKILRVQGSLDGVQRSLKTRVRQGTYARERINKEFIDTGVSAFQKAGETLPSP